MDSKAIGIRVKTETLDLIKKRANRKGMSFNKFINYCISLGLRSHRRRNERDKV